jgi:TolA-binding protein
LLERGEQQWAAKQLEAAQQSYMTFLQRYPTHPTSHLIATRVADVLREQQRPREALEAYLKVVDTYPGSEGALISQIRMAELGAAVPDLLPTTEERRYAAFHQPLQTLNRLIQEYPMSPLADVARFKTGEILLQRQEFPAALETFEQLLSRPIQDTLRREVQAGLRQTLVRMLAAHQHQGDFVAVLQTFFTHKGHLESAEAAHADLLLPVAISYARLGLLDEAQSLLQTLIDTAPTPQKRAPAALEQATLLAKRGQTAAVKGLLTPLEQFTDTAMRGRALLLLTTSALQEKRPADALRYAHLAEAILTSPSERTTLLSLLGQGYAAQGEADKSVQSFQTCAEVATASDQAAPLPIAETCLLRAGAVRVAQGQLQEALALYARVLQAFPQSQHAEWVQFRIADLHRQLAAEPQMLNTLTALRSGANNPLWQKVAAEYLDDTEWQKRFHERLATFQNSLMR